MWCASGSPDHPLHRPDSVFDFPYNSDPILPTTLTRHCLETSPKWKHSMRLIIRYFFKGVHAVVGPILLAADRLTRPRGIKRSPDEQQRIDRQTKNLVMYQFFTCPFCIKTRRAIKRLSLNIETRDALKNASSRQQLLEGGGVIKVPCLRITQADGSVEWLYESNDIINYLNENFS